MIERLYAFRKTFWTALVLIMMACFLAGCAKDDESPTEPPQQDKPAFPTVTFKGPNTTSNDSYAQLTKAYAEVFNVFTTFWQPFLSLPATRDGNNWKWTYSGPGFTQTFTASKQADGSHTWSLVYNGTIDGVVYNNWKFLEGTTSADGKNGSWKAYEDNSTRLDLEVSWTTSAANVLTGTWKEYVNGVLDGRTELINNPDGSGELKSYNKGNVMTFRAVWLANGSGQWWTYSGTTGAQTGTGSWT